MEPINTLCGQSAEFFILSDTYIPLCFEGLTQITFVSYYSGNTRELFL
jgi:hypothetical protein